MQVYVEASSLIFQYQKLSIMNPLPESHSSTGTTFFLLVCSFFFPEDDGRLKGGIEQGT